MNYFLFTDDKDKLDGILSKYETCQITVSKIISMQKGLSVVDDEGLVSGGSPNKKIVDTEVDLQNKVGDQTRKSKRKRSEKTDPDFDYTKEKSVLKENKSQGNSKNNVKKAKGKSDKELLEKIHTRMSKVEKKWLMYLSGPLKFHTCIFIPSLGSIQCRHLD